MAIPIEIANRWRNDHEQNHAGFIDEYNNTYSGCGVRVCGCAEDVAADTNHRCGRCGWQYDWRCDRDFGGRRYGHTETLGSTANQDAGAVHAARQRDYTAILEFPRRASDFTEYRKRYR